MGKPKALVSFCGAPLIYRSLERLAPIANQLIITTTDSASLDSIRIDAVDTSGRKPELHTDVHPTRGALSGIYTALYYASQPAVAIVACDMVFPSAPIILAELKLLQETGSDLVIPKTSHGFEPFHAVYRKASCLPAVKAALDRGEVRASGWYDAIKVLEFSHADVLAADPRGGSFINVNTPAELASLEQRFLAGEISAKTPSINQEQ